MGTYQIPDQEGEGTCPLRFLLSAKEVSRFIVAKLKIKSLQKSGPKFKCTGTKEVLAVTFL